MPHRPSPALLPAALCSAVLALTACGSTANDDAASEPEGPTVVVGFYPLEFIASAVAGDLATVETLTSPGAEPHDVELSPQAIASVSSADLVLYASGLQASVDDAVSDQGGDHAIDVNPFADLIVTGADHQGHDHQGDADSDDADHGDEPALSDEPVDPHFWLDPQRMGTVTQGIADSLIEMDPSNRGAYQANADTLIGDLRDLDTEFTDGLANCAQPDLVTTHQAFGYLAHEYGFDQVGIAGVSPESEPSAARLAEVAQIVRDTGVDTIYAEVLVGTDIADTIAAETGAQVLTLDPVEGLTDASAGDDYLEVMRANLETLSNGQQCS